MYLNCILSMRVCVCGGKEWCVVVWLMLKRVVMIASMCVCVFVCCGERRSGGRERERRQVDIRWWLLPSFLQSRVSRGKRQ